MKQSLVDTKPDISEKVLQLQSNVLPILHSMAGNNNSVLLTSSDDLILDIVGIYFAQLRSGKIGSSRIGSESLDGSKAIFDLQSEHPDILYFFPEGTYYKVKEDVRQNILSEASTSPIQYRKKSLIISQCQRLRSESANSLLKAIEEPTKNINFILLANNVEDVIPTIRSRCVEIQLNTADEKTVFELFDKNDLAEVQKFTKNNLAQISEYLNEYKPLVSITQNLSESIAQNSELNQIYEAANLVNQAVENILVTVKEKNVKKISEYKDFIKSSKFNSSLVKKFEKNLHAHERKIKRNALNKVCDMLSFYFPQKLTIINDFRNRLVFNPNEILFLEALSLALAKL